MARGFRSSPQGLRARLDADERGLLGRLFRDIIGLLERDLDYQDAAAAEAPAPDPLEALLGLDEAVEAPTDPAVARLLPAGTADEERAREFRRFTDRSLREQKVAALRRAALAVEQDPVVLDREAAVDFSRALNDVRLVLSTRLGIESAEDAERIESVSLKNVRDADSYMAVVYSFVSWMQNSLIEAMLVELPEQGPAGPAPGDGPAPGRDGG